MSISRVQRAFFFCVSSALPASTAASHSSSSCSSSLTSTPITLRFIANLRCFFRSLANAWAFALYAHVACSFSLPGGATGQLPNAISQVAILVLIKSTLSAVSFLSGGKYAASSFFQLPRCCRIVSFNASIWFCRSSLFCSFSSSITSSQPLVYSLSLRRSLVCHWRGSLFCSHNASCRLARFSIRCHKFW